MTREVFIKFLTDNNIPYKEGKDCGWPEDSDVIYVTGALIDIVTFDGRESKFRPYLRVSHFDEKPGMCYTRDCGLCEYKFDDWIKLRCIELANNIRIDIS